MAVIRSGSAELPRLAIYGRRNWWENYVIPYERETRKIKGNKHQSKLCRGAIFFYYLRALWFRWTWNNKEIRIVIGCFIVVKGLYRVICLSIKQLMTSTFRGQQVLGGTCCHLYETFNVLGYPFVLNFLVVFLETSGEMECLFWKVCKLNHIVMQQVHLKTTVVNLDSWFCYSIVRA